MAIIENRDDDLKYKKQQIELYFSVHPELEERTEYIRSAYQDRFAEILVDDTRIGYRPQENGLLMWEGAYLSRKSESVFSWSLVAEWTGQLVDKHEYFINTLITEPKAMEGQQMTLFDLTGFHNPEENQPQMTFFSQPELPQQIIDEALCIGANDENSRLIICAYFMKDHTTEENAAFLQKHYRTNGAGFYVQDWGMLRIITDEWASFTAAYEQNRDLMRFSSYRPKELLGKLQDLQREPVIFRAAEGYAPDRRFFISNDEIDRILRGSEQHEQYPQLSRGSGLQRFDL